MSQTLTMAEDLNIEVVYRKLQLHATENESHQNVENPFCKLLGILDENSNFTADASVLASYHVQFCIDQINNFVQRSNLDPVDESEKLLLPALAFVQDAIASNEINLQDCIMKSKLISSVAKLVSFFAEMSDLMIKDLSKACALETLLAYSKKTNSEETLAQQLEMDRVPSTVLDLCECRNVILQHPHECECLECIEGEDAIAQESIPRQFRKPSSLKDKVVPANPLLMDCGFEGEITWPHRCLQFHKAAICNINSFWNLLEFRSKKIEETVSCKETVGVWYGVGDMVAVETRELSWISYEPTSPTAPCLPHFVRAFVLNECPLPLKHGFRALWLPDYASKALCKPDRLLPLKKGDPISTWKPLVYIGSAHAEPPNEILSCAINIIHMVLVQSHKLDDALAILDGKGPWRAFQLIKCLDGQTRIEFLAILNTLAAHSEKGNRGLVACCFHNFLADWFVWVIHTRKASNFELETLMNGINLYLPKIEVKRWPKSRLIYGATNALMKCCPSEKLMSLLKTCIDILTWDVGGRFTKNNRRHQQPNNQQLKIDDDKLLRAETTSKESNVNHKAKLSLEESSLSDFTMIRKQWQGETWLLPSCSTLSLCIVPEPVFDDAVKTMVSKCPSMIRGLLFQGAVQGLHCELMKVRGIRDIRQPAFAKTVCGMLNAGGGDIWIGLGNASRVDGVFVHRSERDSFSQGILDVATYSIEPRLLTFNLEIKQILALDSPKHELHPDRNRYVYRIVVKPLEGVNYVVLPEKVYLGRRESDGATVCCKPKF